MINYLECGGSTGVITNSENLVKALQGKAGTTFVKN